MIQLERDGYVGLLHGAVNTSQWNKSQLKIKEETNFDEIHKT